MIQAVIDADVTETAVLIAVIERGENLKAKINKTELSLPQLIRAREHFCT